MKKVLLICIFFACQSVFAQGDARMVRLEGSLGLFTLNDQRLGEQSSEPGATQTWDDWSSLPSYFAWISFYSYKKWEIGVEAGYQHSFMNAVSYRDENNFEHMEKISTDSYTLTPKVRLNWITTDDRFFEMYSSLSMGLTFADTQHSLRTNENGLYPQPAGQLCLIGMRFGNTFGGYMEMGAGVKGIISFGLSYRP